MSLDYDDKIEFVTCAEVSPHGDGFAEHFFENESVEIGDSEYEFVNHGDSYYIVAKEEAE